MATKHSSWHKVLDEEGNRPAKRRRVANSATLFIDKTPVEDQDHLEPSRHLVRARHLEQALRIEILRMAHKDTPRGRQSSVLDSPVASADADVFMKAKCKISIRSHQGGVEETVYTDSQICLIKASKDPVAHSPVARVYCKPFQIAAEKLLVQHDDKEMFGLADSYTVFLELQSAASRDPNWPPLDLDAIPEEDGFANGARFLPSRLWTLSATISDFGPRTRRITPLSLKKGPQNRVLTNFALEMDLRWSTNNIGCQTKATKDKRTSITDDDPFVLMMSARGSADRLTNGTHLQETHADGPNGMNGVLPRLNGRLQDGAVKGSPDGLLNNVTADVLGDQVDGDITPNRSKRARNAINYNVKDLWNTAVGKGPRKRPKPSDSQSAEDVGSVTFIWEDATVHIPAGPVDGFSCVYCGAVNSSVCYLRAHLKTHPQAEFLFDGNLKGGCRILVEPEPFDPMDPYRGKVYQLGPPVRPFNLEKYVEGDKSWVTSRLGQDTEREVPRKMLRVKGPKGPKVGNGGAPPRRSRTDARQRLGTRKNLKKPVVVPDVKQALFDSLTKAEVFAGTVVPQHEVDDDWLIQKHRDNLNASDLPESFEKEYMEHWDSFALKRSIHHVEYIPRAFVTFAEEEASWIVARPTRETQFAKHAACLLAHGDISSAVLEEAARKMTEARSKKVGPPKPTPKKKTLESCGACRKPVPIADMTVCSSKTCQKRVYHTECVLEARKPNSPPIRAQNWRCRKCAPRDIYATVEKNA